MRDIVIIGGGVVGCSIASYLSQYELDLTLVEKNSDVAEGISKGNSGIIHAGYNEKPRTLKAKLCKEGNELIKDLAKDLCFPFKNNGAFILAFNEEELKVLHGLKSNGETLGIKGLEILSKEEIEKREPHLTKEPIGALYAATSGIVSPYEMTIALAEHAAINGTEVLLEHEVIGVHKTNEGFKVCFSNGKELMTRYIINATGLSGGVVQGYISKELVKVMPVKGEYCLMNKMAGNLISHTIFTVPNEKGKGVLVTPTSDGNLLIGPNAEDGLNVATTREGLDEIISKAKRVLSPLPLEKTLTTFAGVRPKTDGGDFIIEPDEKEKEIIHVIGIDSPGLTAAPAIAKYVAEMIEKQGQLEFKEKENFIKTRQVPAPFMTLSIEEQNKRIKENPAYGKIICRCEGITEGEIIEALNRPIRVATIDGIKRRTRSMLGGCQGGGCMIPIAGIIARETRRAITDVQKNNVGSPIVGFKEEK